MKIAGPGNKHQKKWKRLNDKIKLLYLVCSVNILTLVSKTFPFLFRKDLRIFNNEEFWARCFASTSVCGERLRYGSLACRPSPCPQPLPQDSAHYSSWDTLVSYGRTKTCKAILVQVVGGLGVRWKIRAPFNRSVVLWKEQRLWSYRPNFQSRLQDWQTGWF